MDELRRMSPDERAELACALAALEAAPDADADAAAGPGEPGPFAESDLPGNPRTRAFALIAVIGCGLVLAAWIGILAVTLPRYYRSGGWRGAWVGFDLALLTAFAVTGWAAWRRRQVLIICLVVLATLLCCDAWFDVVLDARTSGFELSVASAVFIELPLAALAILGARRLLHMSIAVIRRYEGETGEAPSLRQAKIIGGSPGSHLSDLFAEPDATPGSQGSPGPVSASAAGASDHGEADYENPGYGNPDYGGPDYAGPDYADPDYGGPGHGTADP